MTLGEAVITVGIVIAVAGVVAVGVDVYRGIRDYAERKWK